MNYDLIPSKFEESIGKIFLPDSSGEILPFWDVAHGGWRSCYIERIEMFIPPEELAKNNPDNKQKHEQVTEENKDADDLQDVDDNENTKTKTGQKISNKQIDEQDDEYNVDPVNKKNIQKAKKLRNTKSRITEEYEERKKRLENARHIINTIRAEAEARKFRRK